MPNGTLSVVSNVEYHFLPGEHYVPANMVLQNLHNFSIIGASSNLSSPVVLVCSNVQLYVIDIINSHFVIIKNFWFKYYSHLLNKTMVYTNLKLSCCFSCKIENVVFLQYGFTAINLIGDTYLYNIKVVITEFSEICCQGIILLYNTCSSWSGYNNQMHKLVMNQIVINDHIKCITDRTGNNTGLHINLQYLMYNVQLSLHNSHFSNMYRRALHIQGGCSSKTKNILIINCTFAQVKDYSIIFIYLRPVSIRISFVNVKFHSSRKRLIAIHIVRFPSTIAIGCKLVNINNKLPVEINISFIKFHLSSTSRSNELFITENEVATLDGVDVFFESLSITKIKVLFGIILKKGDVHFNGPIDISNNKITFSIIQFQSCDVLFSATMKLHKNYCHKVISLDTHIKILEYTNISFVKKHISK